MYPEELKNELTRIIKMQYQENKKFSIGLKISGQTGYFFVQGSFIGSPEDPRGFFARLEISDDLRAVRDSVSRESNLLHVLGWNEPNEIPNMHAMLNKRESNPDEIARYIVKTLEVGLGLKAQDISIVY